MDTGGWFDIETKEWKYLCDIIFIAAIQPPGKGRNDITRRYLRHFALLYIQPCSQDSLFCIFYYVLNWYFLKNPTLPMEILDMNTQIVNSTIWIYQ